MMKTSELIGESLDYVVATITKAGIVSLDGDHLLNTAGKVYSPSTDWSQGGPIIECERICLKTSYVPGSKWVAFLAVPELLNHFPKNGPTPLIAAMRCFVASHLGDTVEIPKEFL